MACATSEQENFEWNLYPLQSCIEHISRQKVSSFPKYGREQKVNLASLSDWEKKCLKIQTRNLLSFGFQIMCFCLRQILSVCWLELTRKLNVGSWRKLSNKI